MASPNIIFNRIAPSAVCGAATPTSLFASLHLWRHTRLLQRHSSEAAAKIRTALAEGFAPRSFAARCRGEYERLFSALERGDMNTLKRSISSACMASTRAGQEGRAPLRARILSWDEAASGVAGCGVHALTRNDGVFDKPPDFVQVVMRNVYTCELRREGGAPAGGAPVGGAGRPRPLPSSGLPLPPLWETVLHSATGTLYWWDRLSQRVTWEQPGAGAFLAAHAAHPFRLETSGTWEALPDAPGAAVGSAMRAKVVHDVVWERAVAGGTWYIVRW